MHPTKKLFPDWWWRFNRYQIQNGYILPAQGNQLKRYDPWDDYAQPKAKATLMQPYHSLLQLIANIESGKVDAANRDAEIETWCSGHGLLGLLLHQSESVVLPRTANQSYAVRYFRETRGWSMVRDHDARLKPGAWVRDRGGFLSNLAPVEPTWGRFFPNVENPSLLPPPFSEEFWKEYAEPVTDFLTFGRLLLNTVERLRSIADSKKKIDDKRAEFAKTAEELIHSLTATMRPMLYLETRERYALSWAGGSLLSNYAMMAVLDLTRSRLLTCRNATCGVMFVTNSTEAKYCSARCRGAVQMRKYRKRKEREAKAEK